MICYEVDVKKESSFTSWTEDVIFDSRDHQYEDFDRSTVFVQESYKTTFEHLLRENPDVVQFFNTCSFDTPTCAQPLTIACAHGGVGKRSPKYTLRDTTEQDHPVILTFCTYACLKEYLETLPETPPDIPVCDRCKNSQAKSIISIQWLVDGMMWSVNFCSWYCLANHVKSE